MSFEIFDQNVGDLVKRGALKPDEARARERFLGAIEAPPERPSWKIAAAAAAVVVVATIVWSARKEEPRAVPITQILPAPVAAAPQQGNDLLRGELQLPSGAERRPAYHFVGKSTLPDGLNFKIRVHRLEEAVTANSLQPAAQLASTGVLELEKGAFDLDWAGTAPGLLRIEVGAPDDLQERDLVKSLKVKEAERRWAFEYPAWDDRLRALLEPQLLEIGDLALEARKILDRCEASVATEEMFRARYKELVADAERLCVRARNFAPKSVYPAALREIEFTVRNLSLLMGYFRWIDGKFAGPNSYYNSGKGDLTYRSDAFAFSTLRRYLDDAVGIGGREFCLWILKDARRAGLHDAHRLLLKSQSKAPGIEPFAERLMNAPKEDLAALEATIRKL
jgi:hypothetical protein